MSKLKDAYFAGLIDGEGCLRLERGTTKSGIHFRGTIEVKMSCQDTILALRENFGGYITYRAREKPHWKDQWRWRIRDAPAKTALTRIFPYLLTKKADAVILFKHWEERGALKPPIESR